MRDINLSLKMYKVLQPLNRGTSMAEHYAEYERRVGPLLPHFPTDVLKDWMFRHHTEAVHRYGWLNLQHLRFEKQSWPTEHIVYRVRASNEQVVEGWKQLFMQGGRDGGMFRTSKLGRFMLEHSTWPIPPVVLADTSHLVPPPGFILNPCHLIEGHHRLAYLRALADMPEFTEQPEHEVWVTRLETL